MYGKHIDADGDDVNEEGDSEWWVLLPVLYKSLAARVAQTIKHFIRQMKFASIVSVCVLVCLCVCECECEGLRM